MAFLVKTIDRRKFGMHLALFCRGQQIDPSILLVDGRLGHSANHCAEGGVSGATDLRCFSIVVIGLGEV